MLILHYKNKEKKQHQLLEDEIRSFTYLFLKICLMKKFYLPHQYTKIYKNSQTTSTKCQYQAAASNPKWWFEEKWDLYNRNKHTAKKVVPIITCKPWKPVATKKQEPNTESEIEKGASIYS